MSDGYYSPLPRGVNEMFEIVHKTVSMSTLAHWLETDSHAQHMESVTRRELLDRIMVLAQEMRSASGGSPGVPLFGDDGRRAVNAVIDVDPTPLST